MVFVGGQMKHWCRVEQLVSLPAAEQKYFAVPPKKAGERWNVNVTVGSSDNFYHSCEMYALNWTAYSERDLRNWDRSHVENSTNTTRCADWVYDRSMFESTIVSRVCFVDIAVNCFFFV